VHPVGITYQIITMHGPIKVKEHYYSNLKNE